MHIDDTMTYWLITQGSELFTSNFHGKHLLEDLTWCDVVFNSVKVV